MDPFVRLFFAVDPSADTRTALRALQSELRPTYPGLRWLAPDGLHLTLKFLGDVDAAAVDAIRAAGAAVAARSHSCTVTLTGVAAFPSWKSPRVLVALCSVPDALHELHERLQPAFEAWGIPAETRAFRPHLTLARIGDPRAHRLSPPEGIVVPPAPFEAESLVLYSSKRERSGAVYTPLATYPLA